MYIIPKITEELKANVYETIIYTSKLLYNNIELEHATKFSPNTIKTYFENLNAFDSNLYSNEKLKIMKDQYVSGLSNIFSVDTSTEKIRYEIQEVTTKLISKLRYSVTLLESDFKNLITKKKQINTLLDKTKKDVLPFVDANQFFNLEFESKQALLSSCQKSLTTAYEGKLFLSHSVEDLLKILWNISNNLFVLEESKTGRELSKRYDLDGLSSSIRYFISREKVKSFKREDILKFNVSEFIKDLRSLPKQLSSDTNSIIDFIISLHRPDPNKQPDSPATTSEMFNETLKSIMMAWSRAAGIFDGDLRKTIEETSNIDLKPIVDIINEIDESNRRLINNQEIDVDLDKEKELEILMKFIELLNSSVSVTYYLLECNVYDILRYLINFDFFQFVKNIMLLLYLNFRNENKDSNIGKTIQNQPEGGYNNVGNTQQTPQDDNNNNDSNVVNGDDNNQDTNTNQNDDSVNSNDQNNN